MICGAVTSLETALHRVMQRSSFIKKQYIKFLLATLMLVVAFLMYLLDRPTSSVWFLQQLPFQLNSNVSLGIAGDCLPSLVHTYAFILITAAYSALHPSRIIIFWFVLECFFECIQSDWIADYITAFTLSSYSDSDAMLLIKNFCVNGTFDWMDLLAVSLGCLLALLTINHLEKTKGPATHST